MVNDNGKKQYPSWDDYFLELADAASSRATCDHGKNTFDRAVEPEIRTYNKQRLSLDVMYMIAYHIKYNLITC